MADNSNFTLSVALDTTDIQKKIEMLKNMFTDIEINIDPLKDERAALDNVTKDVRKAMSGGADGKITGSSQANEKDMKERGDRDRSRSRTLGEIKGSLMRQIGLIAGIAGSIALIVSSSPILQNSLTMIINTITLLVRPIGDVIGLLLRPFIVLFMHQALIPYIQTIYPWIIRFGAFWDSTVQDFFKDPSGFLATLKGDQVDVTDQADYSNYGGIFDFAEEWKNKLFNLLNLISPNFRALTLIVGSLESAFSLLWRSFKSFETDAFTKVQEFFAVLQDLGENPTKAIAYLKMWTSDVVAWLGESESLKLMQESWSTLVGWFAGISAWVSSVLIESWTTVVTWFIGIRKSVEEVLIDAWAWLQTFFENIGNGIKVIQEAWTKLHALFVSISAGIVDTLEGAWDKLYNFFRRIGNTVGALNTAWTRVLSTIQNLISSSKSNSNAAGGIIREHVVGFGQTSGDMYEIGEHGSEAIVPLIGGSQESGGGGSTTVNVVINVNGKMTSQEVDAMGRMISVKLGNKWNRSSTI